MSATLRILVNAPTRPACEIIDFYHADSWSSDAEKQLVNRLQELFHILKMVGTSAVCIDVQVEVNDPSATTFQIAKKINGSSFAEQQKLSFREMEVLGLIMQGYTNQQIADRLFVSYETIKSHRKNILQKTGSPNTAALVHYYHQTFFDKP